MRAKPALRFLLKNRALRYPEFRKFLIYRFTIIMALNMQMAIIMYLVYSLTKDKLALGLIGLWEVIPAVGFSLFSGHFVDIREKKGMILGCVLGYIGLSLFYILVASPYFYRQVGMQMTLWLIYGGVFIGGMLRAFLSPSSFALLGMLVPRKQYPNATTWSSTAWQIGSVIGPLLAGVAIAALGFEYSLIAVAAIELIPLIAMMLIPRQQIMKKDKEPILNSLKQGLRFVFSTQLILAALSLDMFAVLFGGAVALLPVYAIDILKVGEVGYGWLRAAPGIGAVITLFMLSFMPLQTRPGIKLLLCIAGFGITTIVFGISTSFILSFFMLLIGGMLDAVSVVIRGTILQLKTPDAMRGRVAAVNTMFISSSNELGAAESGLTAKLMGTVPAVVFGGCMTLVVVGVTFFAAPLLRTFKLSEQENDKE